MASKATEREPTNMWDAISTATDMVAAGTTKRVDGNGWKVYAMGGTGLVRIDINLDTHPEIAG